MAVRELTARFGADTAGFKKGVNEVRAELTELNTAMHKNRKEQKEVDAQLKDLEKQEKALKEAINSVNKPTEEMIRDFDDLKKKTDELTLKKSKLKTEEQELRGKIKNTNKELNEASEKADKAGMSFDKMGSMLKKAGTLAATGMIGLFTYAAKMGSAADDINTLAKQTSLSTEEIQKFQYASQLIDVDIEVLTGSMARLVRNMNTARQGIGLAYEAFQKLGVSIQDDVTGNLRSNQDVFDECIEALGKIEDETERDAQAMAIFGRSAQELNPLILGGTEQLKAFGDELERDGLILSQQELDKLNEFNDKIDTFKARFQATLMDNAGDMTDAFDELLDSSDEIVELIGDIIAGGAKAVGVIVDAKEVALGMVIALGAFKSAITISTAIEATIKAIKTYKTATETATLSQVAFNSTVKVAPVLALIGALTTVASVYGLIERQSNIANNTIDEGASKYNSLIGATDALTQNFDEIIAKAEAEADTIRAKGDAYKELIEKENRTVAEENALVNIASELQSSYPGQINLIDEKTGAYKALGDQVEVVAQQIEEAAKKEASVAAYNEALTSQYQINARMNVLKTELDSYVSKGEMKEVLKYDTGKIRGVFSNGLAVYNSQDLDGMMGANRIWLNEQQESIGELVVEYNGLVDELTDCNLMVDELKKSSNELIGASSDISSSTDILTLDLTELESRYAALTYAQSEYSQTQDLSLDTLNKVVSKYPQLQDTVENYVAGLISGEDVLKRLSNLYEADSDNYSKQLTAKNINSNNFYKTILSNSSLYINELADKYSVDLSNYKNLNQAKLSIQKAFLSSQAKNWQNYYDAEADQMKGWLSAKDATSEIRAYIARGLTATQAQAVVNQKWTDYYATQAAVTAWKNLESKLDGDIYSNSVYKPTFAPTTYTGVGNNTTTSNPSNTDSVYDKALAAYKHFVEEKLKEIERLTDAETEAANKRIEAIDKEIEARNRLKDDEDIQKRIDALNAQLTYSKLDNFSRMELERQRDSLVEEQSETLWLREQEDLKDSIKEELDLKVENLNKDAEKWKEAEAYATQWFTDAENGFKSTQTVINNNSTKANIQILNQGLTQGQATQAVKDALGVDELI